MKLENLKVLSDDEISEIHQATIDILSNCGVRMDDPDTIDLLAA